MPVLTRVMEENLQGAGVVRAFPARNHQLAAFDEAGNDALAVSNQRIRMRAGSMARINAVYYFAMLLVLWLGSRRIEAGAISIGQLAECLAFITILQMPVRQTSMIINAAGRAVSSGSRLFDILDRELVIRNAPGAQPVDLPEGTLQLENVAFRYGTDMPSALRQVSQELSYSIPALVAALPDPAQRSALGSALVTALDKVHADPALPIPD